jgi:hypothetical protein
VGQPGFSEADMRELERLHRNSAVEISHGLQAFLNKSKSFGLWPDGNRAQRTLQLAAKQLHDYVDNGGEQKRR